MMTIKKSLHYKSPVSFVTDKPSSGHMTKSMLCDTIKIKSP